MYNPILEYSPTFLSDSLLKQSLISFQADSSLGWTKKVTLQEDKEKTH
jgi:hypothetical protein